MKTISIIGASGKMGYELIKSILKDSKFKIDSCICNKEKTNNSVADFFSDKTIPDNLFFSSKISLALNSDVIMDFSSSGGTKILVEICHNKKYRGCVIIGTTGLESISGLEESIESLSSFARVSYVTNYSYGIMMLRGFLKEISNLVPDADIEIGEIHHKEKTDSPSGTSLSLGRLVANERKVNFEEVAVFSAKRGIRKNGEIGFSSIRGGSAVGQHSVKVFFQDQMVELNQSSFKRSVYSDGALLIAGMLSQYKNPHFLNDENIYNFISKKN